MPALRRGTVPPVRRDQRPDPLLVRALRRLGAGPQGTRPGRPDTPDRLAEDVAERLFAEELPGNAWLDVGLWGRPVYKAAAEAALRLRAVSVTGDELS